MLYRNSLRLDLCALSLHLFRPIVSESGLARVGRRGEAAEHRNNQLTAAEYDETTWAARTWLKFVHHRLSVAVHKAVAREVSDALGLSAAVDPRGAPRE